MNIYKLSTLLYPEFIASDLFTSGGKSLAIIYIKNIAGDFSLKVVKKTKKIKISSILFMNPDLTPTKRCNILRGGKGERKEV